jgi:amino acid permease
LLSACLSPVVIKKELAELEWLATLLAVCITIFISMSLNLLLFDKRYQRPAGSEVPIVWPQPGWQTISAVGTIMVAYSYQQNVFPIYESLKE